MEIYENAMEKYPRLLPGIASVCNRNAWAKTILILADLGKTAKQFGKVKHPHRSETIARAVAVAHHLVELIIEDQRLDDAGRRWYLEDLYNQHKREKASKGRAEDAPGDDFDASD
jgi:hypothetical protein